MKEKPKNTHYFADLRKLRNRGGFKEEERYQKSYYEKT
jgi:hypothetical protein